MKVFLSSIAEKKIEFLMDYLEDEWSAKIKNEFLEKLKLATSQISKFPKSCPESKKIKGIYKFTLSKQTSFYYRIVLDEIEIITLIDNRQNPDSVSKMLKKYFN
ncbi:MAG: type II toxin-antitoxin system RelE/ParE family toxin [Vicingaceae bacterium]